MEDDPHGMMAHLRAHHALTQELVDLSGDLLRIGPLDAMHEIEGGVELIEEHGHQSLCDVLLGLVEHEVEFLDELIVRSIELLLVLGGELHVGHLQEVLHHGADVTAGGALLASGVVDVVEQQGDEAALEGLVAELGQFLVSEHAYGQA